MRLGNKVCLLVFFGVFTCEAEMHPQSIIPIRGFITDESGPLSGAIVTAKDTGGAALAYSISDSVGAFSIDISEKCSVVEVQLLGYGKQSFFPPLSTPLNVLMERQSLVLDVAVVSDSHVMVRGDTLRYAAEAIVEKADRTLGDVLKHLPGLELTDDGYVKFNGRPINRLYIDGRNILDNSYNLATKYVGSDAVEAVEVYQNHQPVKALQGILDSNDAALNIELRDSFKNTWNSELRGQAGFGKDGIPYGASLTEIMIGSRIGSITYAGIDATGDVHPNESGSYRDADQYSMPHRIDVDDVLPSSGYYRYGELNALDVQSAGKVSTAKGIEVGTDVRYVRNRMGMNTEISRKYSNSEFATYEVTDRAISDRFVNASVDVSSNKEAHFFRNHITLGFDSKEEGSEISGWQNVSQNKHNGRVQISNNVELTFKVFGNSALDIKNITNVCNDSDGLYLGDGGQSQSVGQSAVYDKLSSSVSWAKGGWQMSAVPGISFLHRGLQTSLSGMEESTGYSNDNDFSFSKIIPSVEVSGSYQYGGLEAGVQCVVKNEIYRFSSVLFDGGNLFLPGSGAYLKYRKGGFEFNLSGSGTYRDIGDNSFSYGLLMKGHNTMWYGTQTIGKLPSAGLDVSVIYKNPLSGLVAGFDAGCSWGLDLEQGRQFIGKRILSYISGDTAASRGLNMRMNLSKGFYSLRTKLDLSCTYDNDSGSMTQDGASYGYRSDRYSGKVTIRTSPLSWWSGTLDASYSLSSWNMDESEGRTDNGMFRAKLDTKFFLSDRLEANIDAEYSRNGIETRSSLLFLDAGAEWNIGDNLKTVLKFRNLLNKDHYTMCIISPLEVTECMTALRPFNFTLGFEWSF